MTNHSTNDSWGADASDAWREWQSNASDSMEAARARARYAKHRAYAKSTDLLDRLSDGTEGLSEVARLRVIRARQAAYEAQRNFEDYSANARHTAKSAFYKQPLVGGLIAVGLGAAIGAMLPRTENEDRTFGAYRDRAFDEANRIFHEETAKLKAVAEATLDEAKSAASDAAASAKDAASSGKAAVKGAEDEIRNAADRVSNRAKAEADARNLGSSLN